MQRKSSYAIVYMGGGFICAAISILFHNNIDMQLVPKIVLSVSVSSFLISLAECLQLVLIEMANNRKLRKFNVETCDNELEFYKNTNAIIAHVCPVINNLIIIINCFSFLALIMVLFLNIQYQEVHVTAISIFSFGFVLIAFGLREALESERGSLIINLQNKHKDYLLECNLSKI